MDVFYTSLPVLNTGFRKGCWTWAFPWILLVLEVGCYASALWRKPKVLLGRMVNMNILELVKLLRKLMIRNYLWGLVCLSEFNSGCYFLCAQMFYIEFDSEPIETILYSYWVLQRMELFDAWWSLALLKQAFLRWSHTFWSHYWLGLCVLLSKLP